VVAALDAFLEQPLKSNFCTVEIVTRKRPRVIGTCDSQRAYGKALSVALFPTLFRAGLNFIITSDLNLIREVMFFTSHVTTGVRPFKSGRDAKTINAGGSVGPGSRWWIFLRMKG
jgi:hypothetical protein